MQFKKTNHNELLPLKKAYADQVTSPLDGMWQAFASMAEQWAIFHDEKTIGYACIRDGNELIQFMLEKPYHAIARSCFRALISNPETKTEKAVVSTAEPFFLSLCSDHFTQFSSNALMYKGESISVQEDLFLRLLKGKDLPGAVHFYVEAIAADPNWLQGYVSERIAAKEIYGLERDGKIIATGECRLNDLFKRVADVGVAVHPAYRKQGFATQILRNMAQVATQNGLSPICSTEAGNVGAQKAIERAGFIAEHRILEFSRVSGLP